MGSDHTSPVQRCSSSTHRPFAVQRRPVNAARAPVARQSNWSCWRSKQPNAVCRCATLATRGRTFGRGIASVGRPALPRATLRLRQGMGSPGSRAMANVAAWPLTPAACALAPSSQQAELAAPQSRDGTHARTPSAPIRLLAQGPGAWTRARWATPEAEAGALLLGLVAHGTGAGGGRPRVAAQRLGETGLRRARESRALASARESGVWA